MHVRSRRALMAAGETTLGQLSLCATRSVCYWASALSVFRPGAHKPVVDRSPGDPGALLRQNWTVHFHHPVQSRQQSPIGRRTRAHVLRHLPGGIDPVQTRGQARVIDVNAPAGGRHDWHDGSLPASAGGHDGEDDGAPAVELLCPRALNNARLVRVPSARRTDACPGCHPKRATPLPVVLAA